MKKYFYLIISIVVFYSCSTSKKVSNTYFNFKDLPQKDQLEYSYALTEAAKQTAFGNFKQAALLYRSCLNVNPNSAVSAFQLSRILLSGGNTAEAKKFAARAVDLDPDNSFYLMQLGNVYHKLALTDSLIQVYKQIYALDPDNIEIRYNLAIIYAENGKIKAALKELNLIEEEFGISEKISLTKQQLYLKNEMYDQAIAEIEKLILSNPEEVRYYGIMAELLTDLNRLDQADKYYELLLIHGGNNIDALLSASDFYRINNEIVTSLKVLLRAFDTEDLSTEQKVGLLLPYYNHKSTFTDGKDLFPQVLQQVSYDSTDVDIMTLWADFYLRSNDLPNAVNYLTDISKIDTTSYQIWEQYLLVLNVLQRVDQLNDESSRAIKYFHNEPLPFLFKGLAEYQNNNYDATIDYIKKAIKLNTDNVDFNIQALSILADSYYKLNQKQEAFKFYEEILYLDEENYPTLNNYAYFLSLENSNLDKAKKMSKLTIEAEPLNPVYLDTYAWILFKMGDYKNALVYIKRAIANSKVIDPDVAEHYADILYVNGFVEEAVHYWELAIEHGNTNGLIKQKILDASIE